MILSIGMMVKDEENHLEECLRSLYPIMKNIDSELVIVDTGSTDRTVEIAKKFTKRVYFHKWNNNFSEMRNITINYCKGEWFLCVDGDEVIESCDEIIKFFNSGEYRNFNTVAVYVKNLSSLTDSSRYAICSSFRLFKKSKNFKFIGAVHNQPKWSYPVKYINCYFKHYGYIVSDKKLMDKKFNRTATILKNELRKDPTNVYYMYQLSVSFCMHGDLQKGTIQIQNTYDYIKKNKLDIKYYFSVLSQICLCYINSGEYLKVIDYANEALKYRKNYVDIYFYLGYSYMMIKKYKSAINMFNKYIKFVNNYNNLKITPDVIYYTIGRLNDVYYYIYYSYYKLNNVDKVLEYIDRVDDKKFNITKDIVHLFIKNCIYDKLFSYGKNLLRNKKNDELEKFYFYIENEKLNMDKNESEKLTELFSKDNTKYARLNRIRLKYANKQCDGIVDNITNILNESNVQNLKNYYGDLLYYMIKYKISIIKFVSNVSYDVLDDFFKYIYAKYDDIKISIYDYIMKYSGNYDFYSLKINKILCRYAILDEKSRLGKEQFKKMLFKYIDIGIKYINNVYNSFILDNELISEVRSKEEKFFVFMKKAIQFKNRNVSEYLNYIHKALKVYPDMKSVIKVLLDEVKNNYNSQNYKMEHYKKKVKITIKSLIENNRLDDARKIIHEYEDIVKDDVEIVYFKSELSLKKLKNVDTSYKM